MGVRHEEHRLVHPGHPLLQTHLTHRPHRLIEYFLLPLMRWILPPVVKGGESVATAPGLERGAGRSAGCGRAVGAEPDRPRRAPAGPSAA
ncbi:predicted protein [Streptomyces viridosporus ATCC 14672]|uniref:Predicted protein n=1 Tax=Streptomyces viridosporus (strain ATCC 14672 / DSM 40746 / JCM 4963 / KCTC 9882 / NRRL B-12104 / FH 1290) TaxID=566461 RepID=D5ZT95_STRV1|nr:predicted protein [Streptomyces viridosporus ATCC 14672]